MSDVFIVGGRVRKRGVKQSFKQLSTEQTRVDSVIQTVTYYVPGSVTSFYTDMTSFYTSVTSLFTDVTSSS